MKLFKKSTQGVVALCFFAISGMVQAGAYDDFFKAIALDQPLVIDSLLERGFDPNTVNPDGTPALIKALQEQSYKAAQALIYSPQLRADVRSARDESPLMLVALRGQDALAVQLVSRGAAINKAGWTPLHYAATGGHLRMCAFLIGAGAEINAESPNGTTPLMMAAMYGNSAVVKLLLESGAEAYLRNDQQLSALDFARKAGREDSAQLIQQVLDR
jgi:ankyrin repeat protein